MLEMVENQEQKKKRKKQHLSVIDQQEETEVQNAKDVAEVLEELDKQGFQLDIQVCPRCKSPKVKKAQSTGGDMWAHIGMLPPSYECPDCGWQERIIIKATNKKLSVSEVELIREAMDVEKSKYTS
jgi:hypothetical protein